MSSCCLDKPFTNETNLCTFRTVAGKALDDDRSDDEGEKDKKD